MQFHNSFWNVLFDSLLKIKREFLKGNHKNQIRNSDPTRLENPDFRLLAYGSLVV